MADILRTGRLRGCQLRGDTQAEGMVSTPTLRVLVTDTIFKTQEPPRCLI